MNDLIRQSKNLKYHELEALDETDIAAVRHVAPSLDRLQQPPNKREVAAMIMALMGEYPHHGITDNAQLDTKVLLAVKVLEDVPGAYLQSGMVAAMKASPRFMPSSAAVREAVLKLPEVIELRTTAFQVNRIMQMAAERG